MQSHGMWPPCSSILFKKNCIFCILLCILLCHCSCKINLICSHYYCLRLSQVVGQQKESKSIEPLSMHTPQTRILRTTRRALMIVSLPSSLHSYTRPEASPIYSLSFVIDNPFIRSSPATFAACRMFSTLPEETLFRATRALSPHSVQ